MISKKKIFNYIIHELVLTKKIINWVYLRFCIYMFLYNSFLHMKFTKTEKNKRKSTWKYGCGLYPGQGSVHDHFLDSHVFFELRSYPKHIG